MLRTEEDFFDLTHAYLRRVHADGVRHVEVFFDPQSHTARGVPFATVVRGIRRALADGERALGITWRLIMCFLRHRPLADAIVTLETGGPGGTSPCGVGLDSAEAGHPPRDFAELFARARRAGFLAFAHAGEEGPAAYVREALDALEVRRVDHGVAAAEDPAGRASGARPGALTMCPLAIASCRSRPTAAAPAQAAAARRRARHRQLGRPRLLRRLPRRQLRCRARRPGAVGRRHLALARNSITGALLEGDRRSALLRELDEVAARYAVTP